MSVRCDYTPKWIKFVLGVRIITTEDGYFVLLLRAGSGSAHENVDLSRRWGVGFRQFPALVTALSAIRAVAELPALYFVQQTK